MTDHPTHKLSAYKDGFVWVAFCRLCSREGKNLAVECPGEFVPMSQQNSTKPIDTEKEQS